MKIAHFLSCIKCAFLLGICLFSFLISAKADTDNYTCMLNSGTCGSAATRGDNAPIATQFCVPKVGEYCGAKAASGFNATPIYAWNHCRYVNNLLTPSIFVPFGNALDWSQFIAFNIITNDKRVADLEDCSLPATFIITPDKTCLSPQAVTSTTVKLDFAPWTPTSAATYTATAKFSCQDDAIDMSWHEYETVTYVGLDSESIPQGQPSWAVSKTVCSMVPPTDSTYPVPCAIPAPTITLTANPTNVTLGASSVLTWTVANATSCTASSSDQEAGWTGAKPFVDTNNQTVTPTASPITVYALSCAGAGGTTQTHVSVGTTIVGQCGLANNVGVNSAPATNLCLAGQASAVSGTGPWTWACQGSTAETTASCSAPAIGTSLWGSCTVSGNPILGSFSGSSGYAISGTGNSYNLVGSGGNVGISGFTHSVSVTGDNDTMSVSGNNNCLSVTGANESIIVSGGSETINAYGSNVNITISGTNDIVTINVLNGNNITLTISGFRNNITVVGGGYTLKAASGIDNIINGAAID